MFELNAACKNIAHIAPGHFRPKSSLEQRVPAVFWVGNDWCEEARADDYPMTTGS